MDQKQLDRINELARKSKTVGLTDAERAEQETLRNAYRAAFRSSLTQTLEHTVIVDADGHVVRRLGKDQT